MDLEDSLHDVYLPDGSQTPHFGEVYKAIQEVGSSRARTAWLHLQPNDGTSLDLIEKDFRDLLDPPYGSDDGSIDFRDLPDWDYESRGTIKGSSIKDPLISQPYDITLTSFDEEDTLSFTDDELDDFPERNVEPSGPGVVAQIEVSNGGGHSFVSHSGGYIKLVRLWAGDGEEEELFEGYFTLKVGFTAKYAKKIGFREVHGFSFWAVRAR